MLEDAQKQAGQSRRTISDKTLLLFASTAILTTKRYPRTNDDWDYRSEDQQTLDNWKTSYKRAHAKVRVKAQAVEGFDKFGAVNAADQVLKNSEVATENGGDEVGMKALEVYFDNLAAINNNKKSVLDQLVTNNANLAATNEYLVAIVKNYPTRISISNKRTTA